MALIIRYTLISIMAIGAVIGLAMRMRGNTEKKGKYNPKTQKVFITLFATPIYLALMVQIVKVFQQAPAVLY